MRHRPDRTRLAIANAAARLIAEDGIGDFTQAKKKALRQLGLAETTPLPTNSEVEAELRTWQNVFQEDEQRARIIHLRRKAVEIMQIVAPFNPYLTGSVLDGTAGRYAAIDIQLFADSAKEIEIHLLDHGLPFTHTPPRGERVEAVLTVDLGDASANLIVYPANAERITLRARDGRVRERARLPAVTALLAADAGAAA